jgi:hypothetical protein
MYEFDDPELADWHDPGGYTMGQHGSFSAHNGSLFCNITEVLRTSSNWGGGGKQFSVQEHIFVGSEMRIRLSSDNKLESDFGGGLRTWGFTTTGSQPDNHLSFRSMEQGLMPVFNRKYPEGHPIRNDLLGFRASAMITNEFVFLKPIEGIDLTEWHTYTILWEPENATFLIDGVVVATTNQVPQVRMKLFLSWWAGTNLTLQTQTVGQEEYYVDEYIQVDYASVFIPNKKFHEMDEEITGLLSHALSLIDELEQKNEDTTHLRTKYGEAQSEWQENQYLYDEAKPRLEAIINAIGHWDEIKNLYSQAGETIKALEQEGMSREATMAKGDYSRVEEAWAEYDYDTAKYYLQKIIEVQIPEQALQPILSILGTILLPTLIRRWN